MTAYLGVLGALSPVGRASQLNPSTQRNTTITRTVGGRGVAWRSPRTSRQWSFTSVATAKPNEVANLQAFVDGEFGSGPFVWVDEWAQATNLLTPTAASMLAAWTNSTAGGSYPLTDGVVAGRSIVISDGSATSYAMEGPGVYAQVPVLPGVPVTVSAWLNTPLQNVGMAFFTAAGVFLESTYASTSVAGWRRVSASNPGGPPSGAAFCRVFVRGVGRAAKPAVSWTPSVVEYHAGQGCLKAIVSDFDQSPLTAWGRPGGQRVQVSTTVIEVG